MFIRKFVFTAGFILLCAEFVCAADFYIRFEMQNETTEIKFINGEFNEKIKAALKETWPENFKETRIPNESAQKIFDIIGGLKADGKKLEFSLEIHRAGNQNKRAYQYAHDFEYGQKESMIEFITGQLIPGLSGLFETDDEKAFNSLIGKITGSFTPEARPIESITIVKPKWKGIPEADRIYIEKLELNPELAGFEIEKRSSNWDRFVLDTRSVGFQDMGAVNSDLSEGLIDYLKNINPSYSVQGRTVSDKVTTLSAKGDGIAEYLVVFSFVSGSVNPQFEFDKNGLERVYKLRGLPEYNFSINDYRIEGNTLICSYNDRTPLIYDLTVFYPDYGDSKKTPAHYLYINDEIARFINENNGNMEIILSDNFKIQISLIKYDNPAPHRSTPFNQILKGPDDDKKSGFMETLNDVRKGGKEIAKAVNPKDNVYSLPRINETIATDKADWFFKMEFTVSNPLSDNNGMIMLKEIEEIKSRSNLPVSEAAADIITNYIIRSGKDAYKDNANYFLDIAKMLIFLGARRDAVDFIGYYKEALGSRRYTLNNTNEQYVIPFYEKLADYYYGVRQGTGYSYTPPSDDLLNKNVATNELIDKMKRFNGSSDGSQPVSAPAGVLFEARKRQAGSGDVKAAEFLVFNFPELLTRSIFRLPGIPSDDLTILRRIFTP